MPDPIVGEGKTLEDALQAAVAQVPEVKAGTWLKCDLFVQTGPTPDRISDYRVEIPAP
jgi:hypothetical protein